MSTKVKVRKADAEKVLALVKKVFKSWLSEGSEPVLIKDWDGLGYGTSPYAILWEGGPYEWTSLFPYGGKDEEFGFEFPDVSGEMPKAVYKEAITSWAIGVYER